MENEYGEDELEKDFREWVKRVKTHYDFAILTVRDNGNTNLSELYFSYIRDGYEEFTEDLPLKTRKRLDKILSQEGISLKRIGIKPLSIFQSLLVFLRLD